MLGSPILYLKGHQENDVPTCWLLLYGFGFRGEGFRALRGYLAKSPEIVCLLNMRFPHGFEDP